MHKNNLTAVNKAVARVVTELAVTKIDERRWQHRRVIVESDRSVLVTNKTSTFTEPTVWTS